MTRPLGLSVQISLHIMLDFAEDVLEHLHIAPAGKEPHMPPRLTSAELEVMQILWEHGELKPAQIQGHFPRAIKNPALRSILGILVDKGHVARRKEGKVFFYRTKTRRQSVFCSMLREVADVFCQGSSQALLMNLLKSQKLTDEELIELKRMAEEPIARPKSKKGTNS